MSSRDIKFLLSFSGSHPIYVDPEDVNDVLNNAPGGLDDYLVSVNLDNTDLEFTLNSGTVLTFDATAFLADIYAQSGVYDSGTQSIIFTLTNGSTFSVPVSALLPVTTDSTIDGDGNATPLSVVEMTGADGVTDGNKGIVPTPVATDNVKFLKGDATWSNVTANDVGLGNVDNTSDLDKPISTATQTALDLKYDASNPDGFVDTAGAAAAAPVQDVNGETGNVVLDTDDISEGVTNLYFTDARVAASPSVSTNTGNIATNTANISSNDTDISNLQAEQITQNNAIALNTAKVSADGSIDTHSDVDTTTTAPTSGQVLEWDGANWVPATPAPGVTDHGALTGLADDDHLQYLTESRHDALPQDNPHNVTATQVGLGNVDNTSDADKPVSTAQQAALDLKYDASNPNGYETPAQLNARDTANRDRANHTGTQTASTISDFDTEVSNNTDVVANTAKVSADGSIDTHSDVDTTTTTPTTGDLLSWDGTNWIPQSVDNGFTIFPVWAEEGGTLANGSRQWSFGNGDTGDINIVIPIDCEMFAISFDGVDTGVGSTVTIDMMKNDAVLTTSKAFVEKDFETLATTQSFVAGDCIGFQTNTLTGSMEDSRVCAWFRVPTSTVSTGVLNDLLDVSTGTPSNGEVLTYNGSNWVAQGPQAYDFYNVSENTSGNVVTQAVSSPYVMPVPVEESSGSTITYNSATGIFTLAVGTYLVEAVVRAGNLTGGAPSFCGNRFRQVVSQANIGNQSVHYAPSDTGDFPGQDMSQGIITVASGTLDIAYYLDFSTVAVGTLQWNPQRSFIRITKIG